MFWEHVCFRLLSGGEESTCPCPLLTSLVPPVEFMFTILAHLNMIDDMFKKVFSLHCFALFCSTLTSVQCTLLHGNAKAALKGCSNTC